MDLDLTQKAAIVTGASAGLGRAIALSLAREGVDLAISGRDPGRLRQSAEEIRTLTRSQVLDVPGDMTRHKSVEALVRTTADAFGTVHILVNNVGRGVRSSFASANRDLWFSGFETNLMSAVYAARAVLPYMQNQQWGRIINITALSATEPNEELAVSNVAKSGLLSLSKTLSRELAGDNILVNAVSPGLIHSPQNDRYFSEAERRAATARIPMGRFGSPEEFADAVTFLCSPKAGYITGQNLIIDGGMSRGF